MGVAAAPATPAVTEDVTACLRVHARTRVRACVRARAHTRGHGLSGVCECVWSSELRVGARGARPQNSGYGV